MGLVLQTRKLSLRINRHKTSTWAAQYQDNLRLGLAVNFDSVLRQSLTHTIAHHADHPHATSIF
jgi:hypothetical protein